MGSSQKAFNTVGYPNGVLGNFSGVTLYSCDWGPGRSYASSTVNCPLDKVVLNEFSQLKLLDTSPVASYGETESEDDDAYASIELNHLSSLILIGESRNLVTANGRNTLTLKDAALRGRTGKILVGSECNADTDAYITQSELYHVEHYGPTGAKLKLLLAGNSTIRTESHTGVSSPDIMVDHAAMLTIRGRSRRDGVGS